MTGRGVTETGSILDRIVAETRPLLEARKLGASEAVLRERFAEYDSQWSMIDAINRPRGHAPASASIQIIAEIKQASPSRGFLAPELDALRVARAYTLGGAAGISVLTEESYFLGSLDRLREVRLTLAREFPHERPSLLRKDFLVEPYELTEARAFGADCVLLIVALLDTTLLRDLIQQAEALDMDALVEVHDEAEAERALVAGASLFGVNNRDLRSFEVDLGTTERIRPLLPADATVVGESGVHSRQDVARLHAAGVRAILVGEAFMMAADITGKMAELRL